MRGRKWFITINDGAESWFKFKDVVKDLTRCKYVYIVHNKEENLHCHIVLNFENARSFESILNTFKGAHIEECKYFNKSIRYLLHLDDADKLQYDITEIVSNYNFEEIAQFLSVDEFEYLSTESLLTSVLSGEICSLTDAVTKWGINQVNTKRALIDALIKEHHYFIINDEKTRQLVHENIMLKSELNIYKVLYGDLEKGEFTSE